MVNDPADPVTNVTPANTSRPQCQRHGFAVPGRGERRPRDGLRGQRRREASGPLGGHLPPDTAS